MGPNEWLGLILTHSTALGRAMSINEGSWVVDQVKLDSSH